MKATRISAKCLVVLGSIVIGAGAQAGFAAEAGGARYTTHIKAVVEARCIGCHGADAPEYGDFKKEKERFTAASKGPRMDT